MGYRPRPQVRRGHKANPLLSLRKLMLCAKASGAIGAAGTLGFNEGRKAQDPSGKPSSLPKDRQDNPGLIARRRTLSDAADAEPA